ncbi:TAXI family TRAP transporter solute-binding subunit [Dethiosulfatarculus sandiegensis]|uniref:C4-dicarboxylate ABC transporter substrate-binding protein n=1 Tax=Dethiosulfatarculus sandiegensis TaxID=1429043 RepID=A0A0D2GKU8_9BACT|nr:TAXI family TRAP transporter solute-binding subunit [Dethiosulfatarculus sandiegensis]KIX15367.1 C4-dicarboxylate ABC transporter substrate-binding protein [Dethiosulfatarculus sandiegensis]
MIRSKKMSLILVMVFALAMIMAVPQANAARRFVSIASGWVAGAYYPMAGAISRIAWKHLKEKNIKVTAESSGASVANAKLIGAGDTDLAILQNDIANYANKGMKPMFQKPIKSLLGVCTLFPEHVQLIASAKSGINSVADLKGKRVAIGPVGSGTAENVKQILEAWGMTTKDVTAEQLKASQASDYIKDGRLDAAFYTVAVGAATIMDTALVSDIKIVPITGPNVDKMIKKYPFYAKQVVPGGTYKGNDKDVPTVSVMAMMAARADLEADIVYSILKAMYGDLPQLKKAHAKFKNIDAKTGLVGMSVPLHPGAEKYFKEVGVLK